VQSAAGAQVLGGADLFLQGFIVDGPAALGDFAAGDLRCVRIPQNAFPFAVGTLEVRARGVCTPAHPAAFARLFT